MKFFSFSGFWSKLQSLVKGELTWVEVEGLHEDVGLENCQFVVRVGCGLFEEKEEFAQRHRG